jgi:hypothetical protein
MADLLRFVGDISPIDGITTCSAGLQAAFRPALFLGQALLEPVVRVRLVVEGIDLEIS